MSPLEAFLEIKRKEFEHAQANNLKALQKTITASVKKTVAYHKVKLVPKQLDLF